MEKLKLFFDWSKFDRINTKAVDLAEYANTVAIPMLKAMEVPITWDNVLSTCRHPEHPRYYNDQKVRGTKYEKATQKEQIAKEFAEIFNRFKRKARRQSLTGPGVECCYLNGETVEVDKKKMEELATVWLTDPKEILARKEHIELCDKLTDFVKRSGVFPCQWEILFQINVETGEITPNPFLNPYPQIAESL